MLFQVAPLQAAAAAAAKVSINSSIDSWRYFEKQSIQWDWVFIAQERPTLVVLIIGVSSSSYSAAVVYSVTARFAAVVTTVVSGNGE